MSDMPRAHRRSFLYMGVNQNLDWEAKLYRSIFALLVAPDVAKAS